MMLITTIISISVNPPFRPIAPAFISGPCLLI
jgi:hypothetical protein